MLKIKVEYGDVKDQKSTASVARLLRERHFDGGPAPAGEEIEFEMDKETKKTFLGPINVHRFTSVLRKFLLAESLPAS